MRKIVFALSLALGMSVLVNVVLLTRGSRAESVPDRRSATKSASTKSAPAPQSNDQGAILREIRSLRDEIAALKNSSADSPSTTAERRESGDSGRTSIPRALRDDPALAEMIRESEAIQDLWKDLQKLVALQSTLGDDKHRELVLKVTAEFLKLDPSQLPALADAAGRMAEELAAAAKEYTEESSKLQLDQKDPSIWQKEYQDLAVRYQKRAAAAGSMLDPVLGADPRHKQFRDQAATWAYYYNPKTQAWGYQMAWPAEGE